ncbi:hypothetical protein DF3PB_5450002 [uncultured Defluviicoccus sp.]|uniref:Uncharacterized protein n=1 Tax=metagenome TaxID=256318 RepID=A0A380TI27_9ZZZZ|nr:hypothetical protein DF3PB_5450002 [uncultured Defluviicoccus sp.]
MLRDVVVGLVWAGLAFGYFMLAMSLGLPEGRFAGEAQELLLILGGGLAAIIFLHFFADARDDRRLRAFQAKMDEQDRHAREAAREKTLQLNAYLTAPAGCEGIVGKGGASGPIAQIIPFPVRHAPRPAIGHLQGSA